MQIGRVSTAMITPFSTDQSINYEMVAQLIEHLISTGTDSLVICGTTGESPTLTSKEKAELIRFTVKSVRNRIPVIAGTGCNSTRASIELTKIADKAGVDGIMLVTPYYNKPDQRGMFEHFKAIANETKLPILLYNIPGRSVVNMLPETVLKLSEIPNIQAIKEAGGNLEQMSDIIAGSHEDFMVYSGDDGLTLPLLSIGGVGVVSVASHVVGSDMQKLIKAFEEGRHNDAAVIHHAMLPLIRAIFAKPNPVPIKYALGKIGLDVGSVRLPLVDMTSKEQQNFDAAWEEYEQKSKNFK
ncbi:4-hydroxy-tetrahydrodipicolinate synthase [Paenisporosarcina sp. TG20]|uniref:4-hydroxy-tetrahydrodipicolinate synthase n=1 Tax=Paenisporosarcina sp. TG20 TaxID=1211706 RepID=UPI00047531CD|nr:4-hydroxy-tetrahydrodipicolinate synthase [Paenisporosarcina sp. TG20]